MNKEKLIDIGTISSRGQISIPSAIRKRLRLDDGSKVLFYLEDNTIQIKKITPQALDKLVKNV